MKGVYGDPKPQYILCFLVNLLSFLYGTFGLEYDYFFEDEDEDNQGIIFIGLIAGTPLFGILVDKIGRKKTLISVGLSFFLAEMLIAEPNVVPVGRFLIGLGCAGLYIVVPIYICETAQYRIRGLLGSCFPLAICLGCMFRDLIHLIIKMKTKENSETTSLQTFEILKTARIISFILFLAVSYWIPETPIFYLLNNKMEYASKALIKLRGNHVQIVKQELEDLAASIGTLNENKKRNPFRNCFTDPGTKKVLVTGFFIFTAMRLNYWYIGNGPQALYSFFVGTFETSVCSSLFHILSLTIGSLLIERCGRRFLLLVSSGSMIMNGVYYFLYWVLSKFLDFDDLRILTLHWAGVSAVAITFSVAYNVGFRTIPWVLLPEILKPDVRSSGISCCIFLFWIESFLFYKYCSLLIYLEYAYEFRLVGTVFLIFCWICTYNYVPETKGEPLEIIPMKLIKAENSSRVV